MPIYRAIVEGHDISFMLDDELHQLDFHRTICLEAECIDTARRMALSCVVEELSTQPILPDGYHDNSKVSLAHIEQVDVLESKPAQDGFLWHFPGDAVFAHKLK